jgi:hypothetical protein
VIILMAATSRTKELRDYPIAYLECRSLTHPWRAYTVEDEPGGIWRETVICASCGQLKDQLVRKRTGAVIRDWRIRYDKDYLIKGGRLDLDERNEIRRLAITARLT